jgi:hypothetical protein
MAPLVPGHYVVFVMPIGGSKASDIKLMLQQCEGFGRGGGRGRGSRGGKGRLPSNIGRIDFNAIARDLTREERKRHHEEGLCFKCHKKNTVSSNAPS